MNTNESVSEQLQSLVQSSQKKNLLDKSAFETLVSETSPEVVYDILTAFKTTLSESIEQLTSKDLPHSSAHKVFHKMKGSSLLVGFNVLGQKCARAMELTKDSPAENSQKEIRDTVDCAQAVLAIINTTIV